MLDPRALTHAQLAEIVADVQAILWQESRMLPDFPREYGDYWNPAKEWETETVEEIADVLDAADLKPPDFMPVDLAAQVAPTTVIDANELLWAARILEALVRVHRNVIPAMREKVKVVDFGEQTSTTAVRRDGAAWSGAPLATLPVWGAVFGGDLEPVRPEIRR